MNTLRPQKAGAIGTSQSSSGNKNNKTKRNQNKNTPNTEGETSETSMTSIPVSKPSIFNNSIKSNSNRIINEIGQCKLNNMDPIKRDRRDVMRNKIVINPTKDRVIDELDFFTNNHFSRSFNSLILDDITDELQVLPKKKINKSPPFNVKQDFYDNDIDVDEEDAEFSDTDEDISSQLESRKAVINNVAKNDTTVTKHNESSFIDSLKKFNTPGKTSSDFDYNSSSSIKRSSKFLNLSIEGNLKAKFDTIDTKSINEIDLLQASPTHTSSPNIKSAFHSNLQSTNKFKRPHKFVSQSPSPSSNKSLSPDAKLYSPSKLTRKMCKNDISSPNRLTPDRRFRSQPTSTRSSIFDKQSNKLRKTTNYKSPFRANSSPLIAADYSNFPHDDMELDSPSKNRKFSNSSTSSVTVYQDEHPPSSHPPLIKNQNLVSDDKENKLSYNFVKPLQTAFKTTGLLKKSSLTNTNKNQKLPETPMKKNPLMLINTNKTSLSNIISSGHSDESRLHEDSEVSIEIGRNNSTLVNDSTTSIFGVPSSNSGNRLSTVLSHPDLDLDLDLDIDMQDTNIPETPTKSVKKSHSTPVNLSPSNVNKLYRMQSASHPSFGAINPKVTSSSSTTSTFASETSATTISSSSSYIQKKNPKNLLINCQTGSNGKHFEPSTPTNIMYASSLKKVELQKLPRVEGSPQQDPSLDTLNYFNSDGSTLIHDTNTGKITSDDHLIEKFGMKNITYLGEGEFSIAFECLFQDQKLAIKRSKKPIRGKLEKKAIIREIEALRVLTSVKDNEKVNLQEQEEGKEYLVYFIEAWEFDNYYYIMTEYCDNGTLADFLNENTNYKIDEFRIWKILIEILNGLKFIHSKNYLHLDLKPANIFVTFEGQLKIGDFGLATKLPILEKDFDLEGDRNYIAPELLNDKIYTPFADIFSVGLIILEIAANIILPDNGTPWRKLRSGDLSDAGQLSSDNISDFLNHQMSSLVTSYTNFSNSSISKTLLMSAVGNQAIPTMKLRDLIPAWAPEFLVRGDSMKLDKLVNKMLRPNPFDRPNAKMILEMDECLIIETRRKAGATIFEGEFGPGDDE